MSGSSGTSGAGVTVAGVAAQGWWLVVDDACGDRQVALAGPFAERADAGWAALGLEAAEGARPAYGSCREDGSLRPRPAPQERAWLARLGEELARLGEEWDEILSDTDPLTSLVVEIAAALVEAGLPLHDCAGRTGDPAAAQGGGVCLTPDPGRSGVVVTWRQHDRMSVERVRGAAADAAVQQVMNGALAAVLEALDFPVEPFPGGSGHVVRAEF